MIPSDNYNTFLDSWLVHIIAVSGGNIAMVLILLSFLLSFLPFYAAFFSFVIPAILRQKRFPHRLNHFLCDDMLKWCKCFQSCRDVKFDVNRIIPRKRNLNPKINDVCIYGNSDFQSIQSVIRYRIYSQFLSYCVNSIISEILAKLSRKKKREKEVKQKRKIRLFWLQILERILSPNNLS